MPVTSLIMVPFSIRKKFWKALGLLYQMTVETTGNDGGNDGNDRGNDRNDGGNDGNDGGNDGLVSCWILDWECYPPWFPRGILLFHLVSCLVCGLKLDWKCCPPWCRGFHPRGVVVSCLVLGSKLDWKCCPPWCRGFHPPGVMVSCLVHGLKLDWKFVSVVSPKWHHGVVSFSRWKQQTLTLKSCDHSFQPIRRLHSVKSHTSLKKLWDFMQKDFPFKEQSCETALLKMQELPGLTHPGPYQLALLAWLCFAKLAKSQKKYIWALFDQILDPLLNIGNFPKLRGDSCLFSITDYLSKLHLYSPFELTFSKWNLNFNILFNHLVNVNSVCSWVQIIGDGISFFLFPRCLEKWIPLQVIIRAYCIII